MTINTINNAQAAQVVANEATQVQATQTVDIAVAATEAEGLNLQAVRSTAAYDRINKLSASRQHWQDTVYKTSNDMLYKILQDCYRLYDDMVGAGLTAAALREALARMLSERGIKFDKSTHTMTKIVRCVFDGDRRRISAYGLALRAALEQKVPVETLADFICEQGGVEEIRLAKSTAAVPTQDKVAAATDMLRDKQLAVLTTPALTQALDAAKVGEQHVLIVTQLADGSLAVNCIVSTQSAVNAALTAYYSANKDVIQSHAEKNEQVNTEAIKQQTMRELVDEAAAA